jgi:hypothetical protein
MEDQLTFVVGKKWEHVSCILKFAAQQSQLLPGLGSKGNVRDNEILHQLLEKEFL